MGLGKNIAAGTALAAFVGAHYAPIYFARKFSRHGSGGTGEGTPAWGNRRSFGKLPRRKQLQVIYGKRSQLKDFENIAYGGYGPRQRRRRRRFGWGG